MAAIKSIFSGPKVPAITPSPTAAPAPTIDTARDNVQSEIDASKRRGRLANVLSPSSTGSELTGTANASLKRVLG